MIKSFKLSRVLFLLLLATSTLSAKSKNPAYISPDGSILKKGNKVDADGKIRNVENPTIQLIHTKAKVSNGTVLLLLGGEYKTLNLNTEGKIAMKYFNGLGYDVAFLQYRVNVGSKTRTLALQDAVQAAHYLKRNLKTIGLNEQRLVFCGIGAGGHLVARTLQQLNEKDQPDDVVLFMPDYMNETLTGSAFPALMPPQIPSSRLLILESVKEKPEVRKCAQEYTKMWIGYDGIAVFRVDSDSVASPVFNAKSSLAMELKSFLEKPPINAKTTVNPAAVPVEGYNPWRHAEKLQQVANHKYDLILIGNSITNNLEKPQYQSVWNQFFAARNALNLGYSGYRTENLLWNIEHGELDGQSPKVAILEIGTNNIDEKHYPTRHTAVQLAGGIEAVVKLMRTKMPVTKIILLRCFPGAYGGSTPTSHRIILERASNMVSKLADGKNIFYCDVNHVFLNMDGSINHDIMPDWLHPNLNGAKAWAQAMEPLLSELMGDISLDTEIPENTAIVPVSKLEENGYDWFGRHNEILHIKDSINPQIVLIGNSITHFWAGFPLAKTYNGKIIPPTGPQAWNDVFGKYRVLNMGFGWDRTQNVLWRLDRGELDDIHPKTVIIDIGTNNTSQTAKARKNSALEIVEGIKSICLRVRSKVPDATIVLMAIFPREESSTHPRRILIMETNKLLADFAKENRIKFVDIGPKMLSADGTLTREICDDFCHPTEKGYQLWADALKSVLSEE